MGIQAPHWAVGAHPTTRGWMVGKELVKAQKLTQAEVDEWYGREVAGPSPTVEAVEPQRQLLLEVPEEPVMEPAKPVKSTLSKKKKTLRG